MLHTGEREVRKHFYVLDKITRQFIFNDIICTLEHKIQVKLKHFRKAIKLIFHRTPVFSESDLLCKGWGLIIRTFFNSHLHHEIHDFF